MGLRWTTVMLLMIGGCVADDLGAEAPPIRVGNSWVYMYASWVRMQRSFVVTSATLVGDTLFFSGSEHDSGTFLSDSAVTLDTVVAYCDTLAMPTGMLHTGPRELAVASGSLPPLAASILTRLTAGVYASSFMSVAPWARVTFDSTDYFCRHLANCAYWCSPNEEDDYCCASIGLLFQAVYYSNRMTMSGADTLELLSFNGRSVDALGLKNQIDAANVSGVRINRIGAAPTASSHSFTRTDLLGRSMGTRGTRVHGRSAKAVASFVARPIR
jgi:hypothetical protein